MHSERVIRRRQQEHATKLDAEASKLVSEGLASSFQEAIDILEAQRVHVEYIRKRFVGAHSKELGDRKQDIRLSPEELEQGKRFLRFLRDRDVRVAREARKRLGSGPFSSRSEYLKALNREIHDGKYLATMVVDFAIDDQLVLKDGMTQLNRPTSILEGYERLDAFPGERSPEIQHVIVPLKNLNSFNRDLERRIKSSLPRVVCINSSGRDRFSVSEFVQQIRQYAPGVLVVVCETAVQRSRSAAPLKHMRGARADNHPSYSEIGADIIVNGDAQYALVELMRIIGEHPTHSNEEIKQRITGARIAFSRIHGSGSVGIPNSHTGDTTTLSLRGDPLDWNQPPFAPLTIDQINQVYAATKSMFGGEQLGFQYESHTIRALHERSQALFARDHYFNSEHFGSYVQGTGKNCLNLNHSSISVGHGEPQKIQERWNALSDHERGSVVARARDDAADLVGVERRGVMFARNTTEAGKVLSWLVGLVPGDHVLSTNAEHVTIAEMFGINTDHGNPEGRNPLSAYATFYTRRRKKRYPGMKPTLTGVKVNTIDVINKTLKEVYENIERNLTSATKCFLISHVIRDTGVELPIKEIISFVRKKKRELNPDQPDIVVMVDGAQALGNLSKVDFRDLDCDIYLGTPSKTIGGTVGLGFFDPNNERIRGRLGRLNQLRPIDEQVILKGMFDESLGIEPNVDDEIEPTDIFYFHDSLQTMKRHGYHNGDFTLIARERKKLKTHFRKIMRDIIVSRGFKLSEVNDGTDFIYSFSVPGVNNRRIVEEFDRQGIFVSYIDRTKLNVGESFEGDGVIRVSFSYRNTAEQITQYAKKMETAFQTVMDEEIHSLEQVIGLGMIYIRRGNSMIPLLQKIYRATKYPIKRIALAASIVLGMWYGNRAMEPYRYGDPIPVDPKIAEVIRARFEQNREEWGRGKKRIDEVGYNNIPWPILDRWLTSKFSIDKYDFLTRLTDGKYVTRVLRDNFDRYANCFYTEDERLEIIRVSQKSKNPYLRKLAEALARPGELDPNDALYPRGEIRRV